MVHRTTFPGLEKRYEGLRDAGAHALNLLIAHTFRRNTAPGQFVPSMARHWKMNARLAIQCAEAVRLQRGIARRLP